ncbi:MAG: SpoIID/LytB domain-containing protein [Candidatus Riflebacteria bacterium]|nr:SpoIID/LytB domain-containing protein [Candidatus Riflebacteria bacterium]
MSRLNNSRKSSPVKIATFFSAHVCLLSAFLILTGCAFFLPSASEAATGRVSEPIVAIGLAAKASEVHLGFPSGGDMIDERGRRMKSFRTAERIDWSLAAERQAEQQSGRGRSRRRAQRRETWVGHTYQFVSRRSPIGFNGRLFRGVMIISFLPDGARVVNRVGLEEYVRGVVGGEMGSLSPMESLKAQAVIARTYVMANRGKHGRDGYDVCSLDHCQVYGGVGAERMIVNQAVEATRGVIMISSGEPISTMYHATCGGMTSDNDAVYGGKPAAYLRRVKCPFCATGLNYRWTRRIPMALLLKRLATVSITFTRLFSADALASAPLDRVDRLRFHTERGIFSIKGTVARKLFNLPSTTFVVQTSLSRQRPISSPLPNIRGTAINRPASAPAMLPGGPGVATTRGGPNSGPGHMVPQAESRLHMSIRPSDVRKILAAHIPASGSAFLDTSPDRQLLLKQGGLEMSELVLYGRGYGHQVGLCQSGAVEAGRRGWSYRQILPFYYRGVLLRRLGY